MDLNQFLNEKLRLGPQAKDALEKTCYVAAGGAFGVFIRWLQLQIAFNDDGLPDASVFNVLVPLAVLAAAILFFVFIRQYRDRGYYLPSSYTKALQNDGFLYALMRRLLGAVMCAGALLLFASSETDRNIVYYRILAVLGLLSGAGFPFALAEAGREEPRSALVCACSTMPILLWAFWLITCYKVNSINGVVWAYGIEIVAVSCLLMGFFRAAGFAYSSPAAWHALYFGMLGAFLAIVALADARYMGMQVMLLAGAGMLLLYNWIMIRNLRIRKSDPIVAAAVESGGFEDINEQDRRALRENREEEDG